MFRFASLALFLAASVASADPKKPTYDDDVLPILKQHCNNCHGNDKQSAGLNLASMATLKEGGSSGDVAKPGDPDKSRLFTLTSHKEKPEMPPKSAKIADAQLEILRLWIEQGMRENAGSKVNIPEKPKVEIGLKNVGKGKPEGPPPMPGAGKLKGDPLVKARRPGAVLAMAASPWAPLVAVGGSKQVLLFNTDTGDLLGSLPFDHGQIQSLHFSRNGKLLLAAGGRGGASGKAVLFNVETCAKITEVGIETDSILAADVSPDQTLIAVGSPSKLIRVYNISDGSVAREIKKHTDWVTAVEFSPDGVLLATGDRNGGLFVWEANTGREFHTLRGHTGMISDLTWRSDANAMATSSEDGTIKLWEMENGTAIKSWPAHVGGAASVKFSHDGKLASTGRDKVAKLWDGNGALLKQFPEAFPDLGLKVAFAHDNTKVIAGDWAGNLKAWNPEGKLLYTGDTNPAPLPERIKAVEAAVVAIETKQKQAQAAFNAAEENSKKAQAAYAAAQTNVAAITEELKTLPRAEAERAMVLEKAKSDMNAAKVESDKRKTAAVALKQAQEAKSTVSATAAKLLMEAQQAAAKQPKEAKLEESVKKADEAARKALADFEAAKKSNADHEILLQAAEAKFNEASKYVTVRTEALAELQKKAATLKPMLAPAQAAVMPAQVAAEAAAKAVAPAKAALDAANAELAGVKVRLEAMKAVSLDGNPAPLADRIKAAEAAVAAAEAKQKLSQAAFTAADENAKKAQAAFAAAQANVVKLTADIAKAKALVTEKANAVETTKATLKKLDAEAGEIFQKILQAVSDESDKAGAAMLAEVEISLAKLKLQDAPNDKKLIEDVEKAKAKAESAKQELAAAKGASVTVENLSKAFDDKYQAAKKTVTGAVTASDEAQKLAASLPPMLAPAQAAVAPAQQAADAAAKAVAPAKAALDAANAELTRVKVKLDALKAGK